MHPIEIRHGEVKVYTYKAGLLSRVAHDLQLTVRKWAADLDGTTLIATFEVGSIEVDGAVRKGRLDHRALRERDKRSILETIRGEVLQAGQHPQIRFEGTIGGDAKTPVFTGTLHLRGQARPLTVQGRETAGRLELDHELRPSEWGIQPHEALMGAIKLQDRVRVRIRIESWLDHVHRAGAAGAGGHDHSHGHDHDH